MGLSGKRGIKAKINGSVTYALAIIGLALFLIVEFLHVASGSFLKGRHSFGHVVFEFVLFGLLWPFGLLVLVYLLGRAHGEHRE